MSRPRPGAPRPQEAPPALSLPIGPDVLEVLDWAYRARRPLLLEGRTGIGKSQIVATFAATAGIDIVVLDLSLLEPPDLIGLPVVEGGRTTYAAPAELPTAGRGVLLLEELNRAEIPVMQPALQLLSARRLHSYTLPEGWSCIAAINPEDGDYQVHRLDPALRSRFLQLHVTADRAPWVRWAQDHGVHPVIIELIDQHPDAFETTSPRSWTYASDLLLTLGPADFERPHLISAALAGYLPVPWALTLTKTLLAQTPTVSVGLADLVDAAAARQLAHQLNEWFKARRIDTLALVATQLRHALQSPAFHQHVEAGTLTLEALETRLAGLPGDLREQCLRAAAQSAAATTLLTELGIDAAALLRHYDPAVAQQIREWRDALTEHRLRLVATAVRQVAEASPDGALDPAALTRLMRDLGPFGDDLGRMLTARGLAPRRDA
ncbi:MAG: MoxR family ATPase [Myxococcota bacterium]